MSFHGLLHEYLLKKANVKKSSSAFVFTVEHGSNVHGVRRDNYEDVGVILFFEVCCLIKSIFRCV